MKTIYQKSVALHKKKQGKLEIKSKVNLKNKADLSLAYTPGVAEVCRIITKNKKQVFTHTLKGNAVAVITDGSAVLGLGNLGPEAALPVMEGKCILFKNFANVDAWPICLATQEVEEIIQTIKNIAPVFGGINLEDISAPRCFEIEERLKKELSIPVMHDDQHGTATVVLGALINALKVCQLNKEAARLVISGCGAAGTAITKLLLRYGFKNIIVCDTKGIIYPNRPELTPVKKELAQLTNRQKIRGSVADALKGADVFIGVSTKNILNTAIIKSMNKKAIIFALANPIPEIMPELAKRAGVFIIATGRSDFPNQINNVLAFPGIFRGALDNKVKQIKSEMLIRAAEALAKLVKKPTVTKILPNPFDKRVVKAISKAIY
jgi:malate dehydrogenase (oxaloacetate-decarboxylating)